jgi:thiol-disulfide isomerase/thioredoxin
MRKILATLSILGLGLTTSCDAQTEFSKESLAATLTTIENKDITFEKILEENKGKTLVIEVWASWCGDCIKAMPEVKTLKSSYPNVTFINLSCDKTYNAWTDGLEVHSVTGENYLIKDGMKGVFGKSINLDWIPRFIIVDKNGKIALYKAIEKDFDKIKETLKKLK